MKRRYWFIICLYLELSGGNINFALSVTRRQADGSYTGFKLALISRINRARIVASLKCKTHIEKTGFAVIEYNAVALIITRMIYHVYSVADHSVVSMYSSSTAKTRLSCFAFVISRWPNFFDTVVDLRFNPFAIRETCLEYRNVRKETLYPCLSNSIALRMQRPSVDRISISERSTSEGRSSRKLWRRLKSFCKKSGMVNAASRTNLSRQREHRNDFKWHVPTINHLACDARSCSKTILHGTLVSVSRSNRWKKKTEKKYVYISRWRQIVARQKRTLTHGQRTQISSRFPRLEGRAKNTRRASEKMAKRTRWKRNGREKEMKKRERRNRANGMSRVRGSGLNYAPLKSSLLHEICIPRWRRDATYAKRNREAVSIGISETYAREHELLLVAFTLSNPNILCFFFSSFFFQGDDRAFWSLGSVI